MTSTLLAKVHERDNWKVHFADTMRGGQYVNNGRMAELHAKEAPEIGVRRARPLKRRHRASGCVSHGTRLGAARCNGRIQRPGRGDVKRDASWRLADRRSVTSDSLRSARVVIHPLSAYSAARNGYCQSVGETSVSLIDRGLTQRIRFHFEPALSFVPDARAPPNGC